MSEGSVRVLNLGTSSAYTEWCVDLGENSEGCWFVRKYHKDVPRRGWKTGDYVVEVFTSNSECLDSRRMISLEIDLFERLLGPAG